MIKLSSLEQVSYDRFRKGLREFGVEYNDADFNKLLNYVDKEHAGTVQYVASFLLRKKICMKTSI